MKSDSKPGRKTHFEQVRINVVKLDLEKKHLEQPAKKQKAGTGRSPRKTAR